MINHDARNKYFNIIPKIKYNIFPHSEVSILYLSHSYMLIRNIRSM